MVLFARHQLLTFDLGMSNQNKPMSEERNMNVLDCCSSTFRVFTHAHNIAFIELMDIPKQKVVSSCYFFFPEVL